MLLDSSHTLFHHKSPLLLLYPPPSPTLHQRHFHHLPFNNFMLAPFSLLILLNLLCFGDC
jgi:hypothetical protein